MKLIFLNILKPFIKFKYVIWCDHKCFILGIPYRLTMNVNNFMNIKVKLLIERKLKKLGSKLNFGLELKVLFEIHCLCQVEL